MSNVFQPGLKSVIARTCQFYRLNWQLTMVVLRYMGKRFARANTSEFEQQIYYYYLTLIHCNLYHVKSNGKLYLMRGNTEKLHARLGKGFSDLECLNQIWGRKEYQEFQKLFNEHFSGSPSYVVDAGANVGYSTIYLKSLFPLSRIISIEPDPGNFEVLKANCEINENEATLVNEGLWNKNTFLELVDSNPALGTWAFSYKETENNSSVRAVDFNELLDTNGWLDLDILKIDIEGAESVLFDEPNYLRPVLQRTRVIGIEIHDHLADRQKIIRQLEEAGFSLYQSGDMTFGFNRKLKADK